MYAVAGETGGRKRSFAWQNQTPPVPPLQDFDYAAGAIDAD